jgi:hypothetical protein
MYSCAGIIRIFGLQVIEKWLKLDHGRRNKNARIVFPRANRRKTDLKSVEKIIDFAFHMNVGLCLRNNFAMFHLNPFIFEIW